MTAFDPRTSSEIYESLKTRLQNRIPELTNFIETSFNYVFTSSFSEQQHEVETAALATQLSGWVDYTGKTLTEDDLRELGIDGASALEINQYMDSTHLDEFAKGFGVTRDEGIQATGTLNVTTLQTVTIPEGTEFGTQPDENGEFISFETTQTETISGAQQDYPVEIQAVEVGESGNVPSNTVTYMPNPPVGVDSVTNLTPTGGGIDEQSDESLREDVKSAVAESSQGGTVDGVEGYIENNTDALTALVKEKYQGDEEHGDYPHADVIVFGGEEQNVLDAIDFSHPSGSEHILVRPEVIEFDVEITALDTDGDTASAEAAVEEYLDSLDLGDEVYKSKIIQTALNADSTITNIDSVFIEIIEEPQEVSGDLVANFDDGTLDTQSDRWNGFTVFSDGPTGSATVSSTNPIDGTHSAVLQHDGAEVLAIDTILDEEYEPLQPEFVEFTFQPTNLYNDGGGFATIHTAERVVDEFDEQSINNVAYVEIESLGEIDVKTNSDSFSNFLTFSEGDIIRIGFEYDFSNGTVVAYGENVTTSTEITETLNISTDYGLGAPDQINFIDTIVEDTGPFEIKLDSFHVYDTLVTETRNDIASPLDTDSVTGVTGELYAVEGQTFVEGTDFVEYNTTSESTDAPYDSIKWLPSGDIADPESTSLISYYAKDSAVVLDEEISSLRNIDISTQ